MSAPLNTAPREGWRNKHTDPMLYMLEAVRMWVRDCEAKRKTHEDIINAIGAQK